MGNKKGPSGRTGLKRSVVREGEPLRHCPFHAQNTPTREAVAMMDMVVARDSSEHARIVAISGRFVNRSNCIRPSL
jgi:hypothetical protein